MAAAGDEHDADLQGESPNAITVYVAEDHDSVRLRLVDLIAGSAGLTVVGSSGSPFVAVDEIRRLGPDVAVVDGRLGAVSGLDVCRLLSQTAPTVSCVIVTSAVALAWGRAEAARAGAAAYLVKRLDDFPLVQVIRQVAAGDRPIARSDSPGTTDR